MPSREEQFEDAWYQTMQTASWVQNPMRTRKPVDEAVLAPMDVRSTRWDVQILCVVVQAEG